MEQKENTNSSLLPASPGELKVIRLLVLNKLILPAVINPTMDDWVSNTGRIFKIEYTVYPLYSLIQGRNKGRITVTINIPARCSPGDILQTALRIPGLEEHRVPLVVSVKEKSASPKQVLETDLTIVIPKGEAKQSLKEKDAVLEMESSLKLLNSMAALEIVPAKWIVSELIIGVCKRGKQEATTAAGAEWLRKLSLTRFYKNGCVAFRSVQLQEWVVMALCPGMINTWEKWLVDLIDTDIESFDPKAVNSPVYFEENASFLHEMGTDTEKWFGNFILGLAQISPRFSVIMDHVVDGVKEHPKRQEPPSKKTKNVIKEKGSLQK